LGGGWGSGVDPAGPHLAVELLRRVRTELDGQDLRRDRLDADLAEALLILGEYEQVERLASPVLAGTADPVLAGRMG
jgi:hypothetical protein